MPKFFLFIALACFSHPSFAEDGISQAVDRIETKFEIHRRVVEECLNNRPSDDKDRGCVTSAQYMSAICEVKREVAFKSRYKSIPRHYFNEACALYDSADVHMANFIELDTKSCVHGFQTLKDRLLTVSKSRNLLDEKVLYRYEKNSCKEFRTYVNLCNYVDGHLMKLMPTTYEKLPKIDFNKTSADICKPEVAEGDAVYLVSYDLASLAGSPQKKIYEKVISDYRARIPEEKDATNQVCDEVRNIYKNFRCDYFEKFRDGEPIYYSEKDLRELQARSPSGSQ